MTTNNGHHIPGPPPGTKTIDQVCEALNMSRAALYKSNLVRFLAYYQTSPRTPKLYTIESVSNLVDWFFFRRGLTQLGIMPQSPPAPIAPQIADDAEPVEWLAGWIEDGYYDTACPQCGSDAVTDTQDPRERVWCPWCGILED